MKHTANKTKQNEMKIEMEMKQTTPTTQKDTITSGQHK